MAGDNKCWQFNFVTLPAKTFCAYGVSHMSDNSIQNNDRTLLTNSNNELVLQENVLLSDKSDLTTVFGPYSFNQPVEAANASQDNQLAALSQVRGAALCASMIDVQHGWAPADQPYRKPTSHYAVTGTPKDPFIQLNYPVIQTGVSIPSQQLILETNETWLDFFAYGDPNVMFFPITSSPSRTYARISIGRGMKPKASVPENLDDPCFDFSTVTSIGSGPFWIDVIVPNAANGFTGRCRICKNRTRSGAIDPVTRTFDFQLGAETVYGTITFRGIILLNEYPGKMGVYLLTQGSHQRSKDKMHLWKVGEDTYWSVYLNQAIYLSCFMDGSPIDAVRYNGYYLIKPPKMYLNDDLHAYVTANAVDAFTEQ